MMPRPPLPLGTWGEIRTYKTRSGNWISQAYYRDYDGETRLVGRTRKNKTTSKNVLLEALRDRSQRSIAGEITAETKIEAVAKIYLAELDKSKRAIRTKQDYRYAWNRYLKKPLSNLRVRELRVSVANQVLTTIRDTNGEGAAKHARAVLTAMGALIVRHDALALNPVREIESLGTKKYKQARPVNPRTVDGLLQLFRTSPLAARGGLIDMQEVMSGLGCRIGELLALDWETSIDLDNGTITFHGTVIRVKKVGLIVQPHTKNSASMRTIRPPSWLMDILKHRHALATSPWVFPSTRGTLLDPDNVRKRIREVVEGTPYEGFHPHAWRSYVAGVLDDAGLTPRQVADYIGHDRVSTTQDIYLERGVVGEEAGRVLETRPTGSLPQNHA